MGCAVSTAAADSNKHNSTGKNKKEDVVQGQNGEQLVIGEYQKEGDSKETAKLIISNTADNCFAGCVDMGRLLESMSENTKVTLFSGQAKTVGCVYKLSTTMTRVSGGQGNSGAHSTTRTIVRWNRITQIDEVNRLVAITTGTNGAASLDASNAQHSTFKFDVYNDGSGVPKTLLTLELLGLPQQQSFAALPKLFICCLMIMPCYYCLVKHICAEIEKAVEGAKKEQLSMFQLYFDGFISTENINMDMPFAIGVPEVQMMVDDTRGGNVVGSFCTGCGAKREEGGAFCSSCGAKALQKV